MIMCSNEAGLLEIHPRLCVRIRIMISMLNKGNKNFTKVGKINMFC